MFLDIADQTKIKTDIEVRRQVANAYGNVLISQERVKILENNDNFNEQDWKSLYQLSEKTFVEETESLKKSAAGAGLTDND